MNAWYPDKLAAPAELTAVKLPQGKASQAEWVNALSERVSELAMKEEDPLESANEACRRMNLPPVDNANQLGDALVKNNLELLTYLNVAEIQNQWPAQVKPSEDAKQALKETNLESWVELALSQVNESDLA